MINMNWRRLLAVLLTVLMLSCTSAALAASGTVNVESLVLREEATTKSDALQTLPRGTKLEIIHKDGSWYKVQYGRYTGYVMTRYVKTSDSIPSKSDSESLRVGSSGAAVKELQKRLKELGYYDNTCDGSFGQKTEDAVKAFQKRNGLTADGVAGPTTMKKLNSSSAKKAAEENSGANDSGNGDSLRFGDQGAEVKAMQKRLKELGYYNSTLDGVFGTGTNKALRAFQEKNGLTVDGVAGETTLKKLNSSSAKKANDSSSSKDDDNGDATESLKPGASGSAVKTLQTKLMSLGYYTSTLDGSYGPKTVDAVKAFQKKNGLTADGVAGTATLKVLYSSSAKGANDKDSGSDDAVRPGDNGSAVKEVQTRLKELGYYKNAIDGSYGSITKAAVKAFQQKNGLTADGVAGAATLAKLNSSSAKKADDKDDSSGSSDNSTLRPGDSGTRVKELQYRLRELGYYTASRDGSYGTQTRNAVMAFQKRNGLTADGVAGPATLTRVYSSSAISASASTGSSSSGNTSSGSTSSGTLSTAAALKPGDSGTQVRLLQERLGVLGYYTAKVDGDYGFNTRQAVLAFQKNNGLTQDGVAGTATLKKLVSSSAVGKNDVTSGKYVTERLDWFNGGASRIPRKAIFQVKDVRTGLVFTAKRQAGGYHLDAEPLTAADSAILKRINGGEYSWRRRPMLVLYDGRVYACSIYSEPHGNDTIPDNNFDGQFCLHFYGSKTHGTDRVDEDHAACEAEALKATW